MNNRDSNYAVSEILGAVLLLGITITLFVIVNFFVFSFSFSSSVPSVNLIGTIDVASNNITIDHNGGESLDGGIQISISLDETTYYKNISDLTDEFYSGETWYFNDVNKDKKWNFGERVIFSPTELITDKNIRIVISDPNQNIVIWSVILNQ